MNPPVPRMLVLALIAALALNAALALLWLQGGRAPAEDKPRAGTHAGVPRSGVVELDADTWPNLDPADLPSLVARLRAEEFPPNIIRAIVSAQLTARFAERKKAVDPSAGSRPFWKDQPPDAKLQIALRQLDFEQNKMLRQLLGDDARGDDLWSRRQRRDAWAAELPSEKAAQIKRLRDDFDEKRYEIYATGVIGLDGQAKLKALDQEQQEAVAKLLTPRELDAYEVRASNTANNLRARLSLFEPTEQEFRALYDLQRGFDQRFANYGFGGTPTEEQQRERADAQKQLREQFKAALGPPRFADYERATDFNYQQTARLVARLELPGETAGQIWSVQKDTQERATKIREDRALTEQQRGAQLSALAADASTKINTTLGARAFEAYKDNAGGWLNDLTRPRPGS